MTILIMTKVTQVKSVQSTRNLKTSWTTISCKLKFKNSKPNRAKTPPPVGSLLPNTTHSRAMASSTISKSEIL